jgi:hypothetical protein
MVLAALMLQRATRNASEARRSPNAIGPPLLTESRLLSLAH